MTISENIKKFRQENNLSQEQLAEKLNIARQSVSKWENGETLPSIDNLILLSGLLNISLDELITGEPYLYFPFNFGKPKSKIPILILMIILILGILFVKEETINNTITFLCWSIIVTFILYSLIVLALPFDYKRYYSYWTINKKGISYATPYLRTPGIKGYFDEYILPIKAFFYLRKTTFVKYSEIDSIEITFKPFKVNPDKAFAFGAYTPRFQSTMREDFFFKVTTKKGNIFFLDLKKYYYTSSKEHQCLPTIISFFKRKDLKYIDKNNISNIILKKEENFIQEFYNNIM